MHNLACEAAYRVLASRQSAQVFKVKESIMPSPVVCCRADAAGRFHPMVLGRTRQPLGILKTCRRCSDRDLSFGDPEISGAQLSPDASSFTFIRPYQGFDNIWIKSSQPSTGQPLTATTSPLPGYFWTQMVPMFCYCPDKGGDETFTSGR